MSGESGRRGLPANNCAFSIWVRDGAGWWSDKFQSDDKLQSDDFNDCFGSFSAKTGVKYYPTSILRPYVEYSHQDEPFGPKIRNIF